jgi:two-component system nitrate/nitrite sensor histidine kinase NarX
MFDSDADGGRHRAACKHHDELLGTYSIFVERPGVSEREDIMDLLSTIGQHIGVAVAKHRSDNEARRLSIVEERASLAHELHDSLAQTWPACGCRCACSRTHCATRGSRAEARAT